MYTAAHAGTDGLDYYFNCPRPKTHRKAKRHGDVVIVYHKTRLENYIGLVEAHNGGFLMGYGYSLSVLSKTCRIV